MRNGPSRAQSRSDQSPVARRGGRSIRSRCQAGGDAPRQQLGTGPIVMHQVDVKRLGRRAEGIRTPDETIALVHGLDRPFHFGITIIGLAVGTVSMGFPLDME